ncbi:hypothetical protein J7K41_00135 [Candidatus Micrarchaeota archaeon]|nr:hypothetical protein [Candidatus Micrarchaeota archaeon]
MKTVRQKRNQFQKSVQNGKVRNKRPYQRSYRRISVPLVEDIRDPKLLRFDAHVHTTVSDGLLRPKDIPKILNYPRNHLDYIAVTDHECAAYYDDVNIINGIEVVARFADRKRRYYIHLTGLGIQKKDIQGYIKFYDHKRNEFYHEVIDHLRYKIYIDEMDFKSLNRLTLPQGIWKIAEFIVKGLPESVQRFSIERVHNSILSRFEDQFYGAVWPVEDFVHVIHLSGGKVMFAHPGVYNFAGYDAKRVANILFDMGVDGIEIAHPDYSVKDVIYYASIAKKRKRLIVMGSDFHGSASPRMNLYREYTARLSDMVHLIRSALKHVKS